MNSGSDFADVSIPESVKGYHQSECSAGRTTYITHQALLDSPLLELMKNFRGSKQSEPPRCERRFLSVTAP